MREAVEEVGHWGVRLDKILCCERRGQEERSGHVRHAFSFVFAAAIGEEDEGDVVVS